MTLTAALRLPLLLTFVATALSVQAADLPERVVRALDEAGIPAADVAVWVQPVDGEAPRLAANPDEPMNPASVMKLVTAFAALERFGPAHRWTTRVAGAGPIHGGALDGDLYLVGGGDPVLTDERLWKLFRRVRALGIERVRGDIVLDGSALRLPPHDPDAFDGRGLRPYNSAGHGLLVHFNTLQLTLLPAARAGEPVAVAPNPPLKGIDLDSRIVTAAGPCRTWYADLDARVEAGPGGPRLALLGSLPASCGRRDWAVAPLEPERFAVAAAGGLWTEAGGTTDGSVRPGRTPDDAHVLLEETSPPLADVLRDMNKWSSNVIARQLLAALGAANPDNRAAPESLAPAPPASRPLVPVGAAAAYGIPPPPQLAELPIDMVAGGADAARAQLAAAGIGTAGLVIENGSGLSRIERVTARMLGELLVAAWRRPYMPEFVASLPVIGVDGTARGRLERSPAAGYAHVKTGYLEGVRAIAGYVLDRGGRRHVVAMLVNHSGPGDSRPAQDALLEWVWEGGAEIVAPPAPIPRVEAGPG